MRADVIARLGQAFQFTRYIPPRQILFRLALAGRRRIERRRGSAPVAPSACLLPKAPLSLFAPGSQIASRSAHGWQFTFLNRSEASADPIDWRLGGEGAANQLWRMNLHYFEWVEAVDDQAFVAALGQWVDACPRLSSGADGDSWNSYALSLRVVVWLQQLARRRDRLDPAFVEAMAGQCALQLHFLETHLERDLGGNHLLKNIVALLWGSAALDTARSASWRKLGLNLLASELDQFLPDGMHYERSSSYHAQGVADLMTIRHALGNDPLGGRLAAAIERGVQLLADFAHPDGAPPLFGDSGLTMARSAVEVCAAWSAMTGRKVIPRPVFDLPNAGYAGLRNCDELLLIDAGPLGPDALPAHAHGDLGSIEWSVAGERVIVDQGVFTYVSGAQRDQSRTARAHNTLAAPGADQGDFFGAFRLGRRCRVAERKVILGENSLNVTVAHDGFVGPAARVTHRRRIQATQGRIEIVDELNGPLAGAAISFLLAPGVKASLGDQLIELRGTKSHCTIATDGEASIESAEWWPDMGRALATSRVRILLSGRSCRTTLNKIDQNFA